MGNMQLENKDILDFLVEEFSSRDSLANESARAIIDETIRAEIGDKFFLAVVDAEQEWRDASKDNYQIIKLGSGSAFEFVNPTADSLPQVLQAREKVQNLEQKEDNFYQQFLVNFAMFLSLSKSDEAKSVLEDFAKQNDVELFKKIAAELKNALRPNVPASEISVRQAERANQNQRQI